MNTAIILAAGKGSRMNAGINKQYLNLKGRPILYHTLEVFFASPHIDEIVLVIGVEDVEICDKIVLKEFNFSKPIKKALGGKERQDSVYNGLCKINEKTDIVIIHDGARPFITNENIENLIAEAKQFGAVSLGMPIKETIKIIDGKGFVESTPNRDKVWITQTPQAFKKDLIRQAHRMGKINKSKATDDAVLIENIGHKVKMIEGSYSNIKITTYEDLVLAELILEKFAGQGARI